MSASLVTSITRRPGASTNAAYWLHIEQVLPPENTATLGEVAELIDELYGVDPCGEYGDEYNPIAATTEEQEEVYQDVADPILRGALIAQDKARVFLDTVMEVVDLNLCIVGGNSGDYQAQIIIGQAVPGEEYKLVLSNGRIDSSETVRETFTETYELDQMRQIELPVPVIGELVCTWDPVVLGPYGYQHGPAVTLDGNILFWGEAITGQLFVRYKTIYDLVDVTVYGNAENEPGECRATCFYHGLVDEIDLEQPAIDDDATELDRAQYCADDGWLDGGDLEDSGNTDVVTCYETVTMQYRCQCAPDTIADSYEVDVVVPCPPRMTKCNHGLMSDTHKVGDHWECSSYMGSRTELADYVSCSETLYNNQTGETVGSENSVLGEAEYYEQRCCHAPEGPLPDCQTKYEKNRGKGMDEAVIAELQRRYGDRLQLIPVSPDDGDCGYIKTTINDAQRNCCEGVEELIYDQNSVDLLADNSSGMIAVSGGQAPYTYTLHGSGFGFNTTGTLKTVTTNATQVRVYTVDACGPCNVEVEDGCTKAIGEILSTTGRWIGGCIAHEWDPSPQLVFTQPRFEYKGVGEDCMPFSEDGGDLLHQQCLNFGGITTRAWSDSGRYWSQIAYSGRWGTYASYLTAISSLTGTSDKLNTIAPNGPSDIAVCSDPANPCVFVC